MLHIYINQNLYSLLFSLGISQMLLTGIRKSYIPTRRDGQHVSILFFTENKKTLLKIYNTAIRLQNVSFLLCLCCFTNTAKKKNLFLIY